MRPGRKSAADAMVAVRFAEMLALIEGPWELPIIFEIKDEIITGRLGLSVSASLQECSVGTAKKCIGELFRQAILQCARKD